MSKNKTLMEKELDQAAEKAAAVKAHALQMGLFEAPPTIAQEEAADQAARGKGGRPAGSKNRTAAPMGAYLRAMGFRDPAARLAVIAGLKSDMDPVELATHQAALVAKGLGLGKAKPELVASLLKEQRQALEGLMPYWHAKLTPDVNVNNNVAAVLAVGVGGPVQSGAGAAPQALPPGSMAFAFTPANIKQNQGLIEGAPLKSNEDSLTERSSN